MALEEVLRIDTDADLAELDKAIDKIDDVGFALRDLEDAGEDVERGTEKASGGLSSLIGWLGKAGGALSALGLVAGLGTVMSANFTGALNLMEAQTGATAAELAQYKEIGQELYTSGWGEGVDDVVASMSEVQRITQSSGDTLHDLTENAIILREVFSLDIVESTRSADTMMKQFGITGDEAFDLITVGFQNGGDKANDLLDTLNEYSGNFSQMGFTAEEFLNILNLGLENGAANTDFVADAMREFNIRLLDGTSKNAILDISDATAEMFTQFQDGEADAADVFEEIIQGLNEIEDPIQRNALGVQIFGTKWEDLGEKTLLALDPAVDSLGEIEDAAAKAGESISKGPGAAFERWKRIGLTFVNDFLSRLITDLTDKALPVVEDLGEFIKNDAVPAVEKFAEAIGDDVAPALEDLGEFAGDAADAFADFAGEVGDKAGPVLEEVSEFAGEAAETIGEFAGEVRDFVARNPQIISFLKSFAMALGGVAIAGAVIMPILAAFGIAFGIISSPILLVAVALAALGAAYQENLFGFRDAVGDVAQVAGEAFGQISGLVGGLVNAFREGGVRGAVEFFVADMRAGLGSLASVALEAGPAILNGLANGITNIAGWVSKNIITPMGNSLIEKAPDLLTSFNDMWESVRAEGGTGLVTKLGELAGQGMRAFVDAVIQYGPTVIATIAGAIALIGFWVITTGIPEFVGFTIDMVGAFSQGFIDGFGDINWAEIGGVLWSTFKQGLGLALALMWQASVWVREHIITPLFNGLSNVNWGEVVSGLWSSFVTIMTTAIALYFQAGVWIKEHVITPLVNAVTGVDWTGVITSIGDFGGTIFTKLKETLPDVGAWINEHIITPIANALSGLGDMVKGAINAAIPDSIGFDVPGVDLGPLGSIDGQHIGLDIPDPFPGYATGTPWTGSGRASDMAGVVHQREAVVPEGGMRVYPSKNGLMLDGGGMAQEIVIPITLELDGRVIFETVKRLEGLRAT